MKKQTMKVSAAFLMLIATLGSCVKGDKGDTGLAGANGANGSNGTNGTNGNANVQSGLVTINPSNWLWDASSQTDYVDINDTQITSDIVASGTISVFITSVSGTWTALPCTFWGSPSITYNYKYSLNTVEIELQNTNLTNSIPSVSVNVKIVAITASQRLAHPNVNWKDYTQIQAALGSSIKETNLQ